MYVLRAWNAKVSVEQTVHVQTSFGQVNFRDTLKGWGGGTNDNEGLGILAHPPPPTPSPPPPPPPPPQIHAA